MVPKRRVVVLFGGRSAEHEVSCTTAVGVLRALDPRRYDVVPVGITTGGRWVAADAARAVLASGGPGGLPPAIEASGAEVSPVAELRGGDSGSPVVVLPLLHGPFGEDGTVQGLCELAGVPYVGSGVLGSAVCMDKVVAKRLLGEAGLAVARGFGMREDEVARLGPDALAARVGDELGWPAFVKPANLGSSVGVSKVGGPAELATAVAAALGYDEWIVVEEAVAAREIECAVLGDLDPQASVPGEVVPAADFYTFEDKYVDGAAQLLIPAPLPPGVVEEVRRLSVAAYGALRAEGMARVDFLYEEDGRGLLVNEVNTIPGFTPISMYPKLWEASGLPYPQLLDRLIDLAVARHERRSARVGRPRG